MIGRLSMQLILVTSARGATPPSAASAEHGSYLGISCRQGDGARRLKMALTGRLGRLGFALTLRAARHRP
jgi:hypothetical protein